jgi:putative ABC transport system permease protein
MPLERLFHDWYKDHGFRPTIPMVVGAALGIIILVLAVLYVCFPKFSYLVFKNIRRNLLRTALTSLAVVVLCLVVTSVWSILVPLDYVLTEKTQDIKAIVTERWQIPSQMPSSYATTLEEGAWEKEGDIKIKPEDSMTWSFYVGSTDPERITWESFVFFFVMDPRKLPTMMDELENIDRSYVEAMATNRRGCILGRNRLKRLDRKIGDRITVTAIGAYKELDLEFEIVGVFPDLPRYNESGVMNRDYLQGALDKYEREKGKKHPAADKNLNLVWLRVPTSQDFGRLSNQIMSSPNYTNPAVKCETSSSGSSTFFESYQSLLMGVKWLLVPALLAIMALVMAMAISISVRERRTEMAVLKVLGFTPARIMALVLGEALVVGVVSGVASAALAYALINGNGWTDGIPFPIAWMNVWPILPDALWWGALFGAGTSLAGSLMPALSARNTKVSEVFAKIA